ncbi:MAG TPA: hypothetical protein VF503_21510 [Sphingobium sp.]|uniref:hypothetical protein n=1 Tax=Sphingobium sp. TaxID=1912891 RepID=UPI002ED2D18C
MGEAWAIHNIHAPSVQLIDGGYQLTPGVTIKVGAPINGGEGFDTRDDAESWRLARLEEWKGRSNGTA